MHLLQPCRKISAKIQIFLFSFQPNMSHIFFRKKKFSSIVPLDTENDVLIILSKFHCHDLPSFSDQRLKRILSNLFFKKKMFYPSKFFRQFLKCYRSLYRNKDPLYFFLCDTHEVFFRKPKKQFPQPYLHSHVQKSWQLSLQFQKQFYEKTFFRKRNLILLNYSPNKTNAVLTTISKFLATISIKSPWTSEKKNTKSFFGNFFLKLLSAKQNVCLTILAISSRQTSQIFSPTSRKHFFSDQYMQNISFQK